MIRDTLAAEADRRAVDSDFAKEARPSLAAIDTNDRAAAIHAVGQYLQRMGEPGPVQKAYLTLVWARRFDGVFPSHTEEILAGVPTVCAMKLPRPWSGGIGRSWRGG